MTGRQGGDDLAEMVKGEQQARLVAPVAESDDSTAYGEEVCATRPVTGPQQAPR